VGAALNVDMALYVLVELFMRRSCEIAAARSRGTVVSRLRGIRLVVLVTLFLSVFVSVLAPLLGVTTLAVPSDGASGWPSLPRERRMLFGGGWGTGDVAVVVLLLLGLSRTVGVCE
jgi:hypothetical protein